MGTETLKSISPDTDRERERRDFMKQFGLVPVLMLIAAVLGLSASSAPASNFPQKVSLILRQKVSCRDAKRLVKRNRLFVHCSASDHFSNKFEADYLGNAPLNEVLAAISTYDKIQAAVPGAE